ncbi:hypothetical protein LGT41_0006580 [Abyssibius alkaniclasticus]|uniref:hypothetical protein n=1 Tax=Abyssibius alkaniclasticus TaxID=2881234 RepID=UPI0023636C65|nr:hypothetical protein [Abyssibius alkaniclasticus]UPH72476.1 hypothetical protein LGT41_0006580 [Abyssibius alkaniclasticus]|tara:strand:+ start:944 stop:1552 length:609 start_codon:yes stop_codon:yes gene_type:complete
MAVSIPTHAQWKKFKTTHGVGANAVSSVNVGKSLDAFHKVYGRDFAKNAAAAAECYKALATYLAKFPDKSAKDAKKFKSEFEKTYVNMASAAKEEFSAMAGEVKAFAGRVAQLLAAAGKLKAGGPLNDLQLFRQGPVRGMLAAATQVKTYDPKDFVKLWKHIDDTINKLDAKHSQDILDKVVKLCHVTAKTSMDLGKKGGLF